MTNPYTPPAKEEQPEPPDPQDQPPSLQTTSALLMAVVVGPYYLYSALSNGSWLTAGKAVLVWVFAYLLFRAR